jgi:hypothetical protein
MIEYYQTCLHCFVLIFTGPKQSCFHASRSYSHVPLFHSCTLNSVPITTAEYTLKACLLLGLTLIFLSLLRLPLICGSSERDDPLRKPAFLICAEVVMDRCWRLNSSQELNYRSTTNFQPLDVLPLIDTCPLQLLRKFANLSDQVILLVKRPILGDKVSILIFVEPFRYSITRPCSGQYR